MIPTKYHEKKQTKRQGVLESNMPAPAGIVFLITWHKFSLPPGAVILHASTLGWWS